MNDTPLLEQLRPIEGLDPIGPWPLAIGWWILIGFGLALLSWATASLLRWLAFRRSWKYDTLAKLNDLLHALSEPSVTATSIQNSVILFSEYLRCIALRRFPRNTCAGLTGNAWLEWLSQHDSKQFDWVKKGKCLIHAPYAPTSPNLKVEELKTLVQAAKEWVH